MHVDQRPLTAETARRLVGEQFPQWRGLELRELRTQGTANAIYRLGDGLAARFPLRPADAGETRRAPALEAEAMRELRAHTSERRCPRDASPPNATGACLQRGIRPYRAR